MVAPPPTPRKNRNQPERELGRTASAVLEQLVAQLGSQNAVVIAQKTLARLVGCTTRTLQTGLTELEAHHWIQILRLNRSGTVCAYLVRHPASWKLDTPTKPDTPLLASFSAAVVVDVAEQAAPTVNTTKLRKLGRQGKKPGISLSRAPAGAITHTEKSKPREDVEYRNQLEALGQLRLDQE